MRGCIVRVGWVSECLGELMSELVGVCRWLCRLMVDLMDPSVGMVIAMDNRCRPTTAR